MPINVNLNNVENSTNKVTAFQVTPTDTAYPSEKLVKDSLDGKQAAGSYATGTGTADGTNTGDETLLTLHTKINAASDYNALDDADKFAVVDPTDATVKTTTWANIKSKLYTYFAGFFALITDSRFDRYRSLILTNTVNSHTGSTAETILNSELFDANSFIAADKFIVEFFYQTLGTGGTKEFKIYLNTAATLDGSEVQIGRITTAAAQVGGMNQKTYKVFNSTTLKSPLSATNNLNTSYVNNGTYTEFTTNFAVNLYLIITGTVANAADTVLIHGIELTRQRL